MKGITSLTKVLAILIGTGELISSFVQAFITHKVQWHEHYTNAILCFGIFAILRKLQHLSRNKNYYDS